MKILCVIPALPSEVTLETLRSIWNQTIPVTETLILTEQPHEESTFPEKLCKILNNGLQHINLEGFDYILKVDADSVLPANFVEANLSDEPDVVGLGMAMLIKTSTFTELMDGRFFEEQDDSYIRFKFASENRTSRDYSIEPVVARKDGAAHGIKYFVDRGTLMYKFGYGPVHVLSKLLLQPRNALLLVGYLKAWLQRKKMFDVSDYVKWYQVQHFIHPKRLLGKMKAYL
jgi:hypothetical protein